MTDKITRLQKKIQHYLHQPDASAEAFKREFLGKKGALHDLFAELKTLGGEEKKQAGKQLNALKALAEKVYTGLMAASAQVVIPPQVTEDLTLPPSADTPGTLHVLRLMENRIVDILSHIGFELAEGPEIEDDWHNFSALNFPEHHPARDMQDTFFIAQAPGMVLRTHTSSVQVRVLEQGHLPVRILSVGRVFRNETISARSHCMFHQVEGLYVDKDVSFVDLKEVLAYFVAKLFGASVRMRLRPSFFPFTEPTAEVDIECLLCKGSKCSVCKHTGWVEIGGAGMVHPKVLENCKVDTKIYTGYAFGMGIERIAMLLYKIDDIRLFTENDLRFLRQFHV